MAKKHVAEKEIEAKKAELQGTDARLTEKETIESEADSLSIEQIKSSLATPDQDFDWDADDKAFGKYSDEDRKKFEDMYTDTFNQINQGEIISGIVVSINNKDVVLNVGFKSDGLVSTSEFRDTPDLKIGDTVDVFVEAPEDANGQLILSRKRAKTQRSWESINEALDNDRITTDLLKAVLKVVLL